MLTCPALVPTLVVASNASHQLLSLGTGFGSGHLLEVFRVVASQRGRQTPTMENLDFAILPYPERESEIVWFRRTVHRAVLQVAMDVCCKALRSQNIQVVWRYLSRCSHLLIRCVTKSPQHGVDSGLIARALCLEPFKHILIHAQ